MVLIIVGVIAAAILAGCAQIRQAAPESGEQEMDYHKINAEEAKRMIDEMCIRDRSLTYQVIR